MTSLTKKISVLLIVLGVAGGAWIAYDNLQEQKVEKTRETVLVERGSITDTVSAQGKLEPKDYVDVGAQVSGQIKKLYVDIGDKVKTGDLLAEIDPKTYQSILDGDQAQMDSLQAQLAQQQAQTAYDRQQYERAVTLVKTKAISQESFEEKDKLLKVAEATIKSLEAQIAAAKASIEKDNTNLGYTKIYAPMDGIVSDRTAREGQTLNANQTTPTILQIANLKVMTIRAEIAEADVMRLKPDMESSFTTMGDQERKWKGHIRQILPTPEVVNDVVLYNALIDVDNEDGQLMNGMSTQVSFIVAQANDSVTLPVRALGLHYTDRDSEMGKVYQVHVMKDDGKLEPREVTIGLMTRAMAEIKQGLSIGERVTVSEESGLEAKSGSGKDGKQKTSMPPGMGARL
ncbi:MAG: efflux RND transporter periplasmic adaptor subunit [Alphaproteobacteria bacterium]|nr:efflux RND transporter periplasmic adaptor subunit [Alphaproteobacteria bacterium]